MSTLAASRPRGTRLLDREGRPVVTRALSMRLRATCFARGEGLDCTVPPERAGSTFSPHAMRTACDMVNGRLRCWRSDALAPEATRVFVDGPSDVVASVGVLPSSFAVQDRSGAPWTFRGGDAVVEALTREPVDDAVALAGSGDELCVLRRTGRVHCWGGQGSDATAHPSAEPIRDLPPLTSIAGGDDHFCGLTAAGEAWCWGGADGFGALPPDVHLEPYEVPLDAP